MKNFRLWALQRNTKYDRNNLQNVIHLCQRRVSLNESTKKGRKRKESIGTIHPSLNQESKLE